MTALRKKSNAGIGQNVGPRFIARFTNGIWQIFDVVFYGVVNARFLKRDADQLVAELNGRGQRR